MLRQYKIKPFKLNKKISGEFLQKIRILEVNTDYLILSLTGKYFASLKKESTGLMRSLEILKNVLV